MVVPLIPVAIGAAGLVAGGAIGFGTGAAVSTAAVAGAATAGAVGGAGFTYGAMKLRARMLKNKHKKRAQGKSKDTVSQKKLAELTQKNR